MAVIDDFFDFLITKNFYFLLLILAVHPSLSERHFRQQIYDRVNKRQQHYS
ncbi:hypothetical protein D3C85_1824990 [compost metagenome]